MLTSTFKRITHAGSMVRFPVHKGYYGKPAHHIGASNLKWLLISKLLNPQPAAPGQDALGLITIYPRPDEHFIISSAAPAAAAPSITTFLLGRAPRLQRLSRPFSVQEHLTILIGGCQLIQKTNRITVYPFTHSANG